MTSSDRTLRALLDGLHRDSPPTWLSAPLLGVWHALRGEWDLAHDAVQDDTPECAWVHAVLHREEGDHGNAGYWYRRAGKPAGRGALRAEYEQLAAELLVRFPG